MRYLICLIIGLFCQPIYGQINQSFNLEYSISDFDLNTNDGLLYISSDEHTLMYSNDESAPALPYIAINILIANNREYAGHSTSSSESLILNDVNIVHNSSIIPSESSKLTHLTSTKYTNSEYPLELLEYKGTTIIGGHKIISFLLCPFRYDTTTGKLYLKNNVTINISLNTTTSGLSRPDPNMRDAITQLIVNPQDINSIYIPYPHKIKSILPTEEPKYEYLIITCDSLKSEFQHLANWKMTKGVRAKVLTVEEIYLNSQWTRPQHCIKQAIMNEYVNSGKNLQYVLIGGDHENVPTEHCYVKNGIYQSNIASDLYYASLKTVEWDTNHNGKIGEPSDNIDLSSDIIVTRLSVNNLSDAHNQINRIINYERNPNTKSWDNKILLAGVALLSNIHNYNGQFMTDTHYKCENYFYPNYIRDYWPEGEKYMFYDTGTSFEGDKDYNVRKGQLTEQLKQGYTFINMITHGGWDYWRMEWCPDSTINGDRRGEKFYSADASQIYNSGNSIITTASCLTNDFSNDSIACLGETFMSNPYAGIIAYYGCTHNGWCSTDTLGENPSDRHIGHMYKHLFMDNRHQMGRAVYDAKRDFGPFAMLDGSNRWLNIGMHLLGDPEMSVYLTAPQVLSEPEITIEDSIIHIETNINDCKICVTSREDYGQSYFAVSDSVDSDYFTKPSEPFRICITKQGYIPYIITVADNLYIQNETIDYPESIMATKVYVGTDVTGDKPQGPVIIKGTTVNINVSNKLSINNGFKLEKGAILRINNN